MAVYVLDNSFTMTWLFEDERRTDSDQLRKELVSDSAAFVPQLWIIEVANGILVGERRKRIGLASIQPFIEMIESLQINEDNQARSKVFSTTLGLARQHGLTVYDAAYLELALRVGARLASLDNSLRKAAKTTGVELFPERL
jgi:predicted nucleic acid-binding protein